MSPRWSTSAHPPSRPSASADGAAAPIRPRPRPPGAGRTSRDIPRSTVPRVARPTPDQLVDATRAGDRSALARAPVAGRAGRRRGTGGGPGAPRPGRRRLHGRDHRGARAPASRRSPARWSTWSAARDDRVAVLAIDPSSPFSGGAILGDRVRMGDHALDDGVFIRSMATRGHLGGLAVAAPEAVRVLDRRRLPVGAARDRGGRPGRGRGRRARPTPRSSCVNPGWGDAVQANKAGLMEIADVFVVNKADRARSRRRPPATSSGCSTSPALEGWRPPVVCATAATGDGVADVLAGDRRPPGPRRGRRRAGRAPPPAGGRGGHAASSRPA